MNIFSSLPLCWRQPDNSFYSCSTVVVQTQSLTAQTDLHKIQLIAKLSQDGLDFDTYDRSSDKTV